MKGAFDKRMNMLNNQRISLYVIQPTSYRWSFF